MYSQLHTFFAVFVKTFNINSTTAACASLNIKFFDLKHCRSLEFPWPNEKFSDLFLTPKKLFFLGFLMTVANLNNTSLAQLTGSYNNNSNNNGK